MHVLQTARERRTGLEGEGRFLAHLAIANLGKGHLTALATTEKP